MRRFDKHVWGKSLLSGDQFLDRLVELPLLWLGTKLLLGSTAPAKFSSLKIYSSSDITLPNAGILQLVFIPSSLALNRRRADWGPRDLQTQDIHGSSIFLSIDHRITDIYWTQMNLK